jgi:cysteine desulfurase/selenocysteine lyase
MEINKYKKDYPFFKNNPNIIFFDNASTALKPKCVIDAVNHYYNDLCVNAHRGDYYLSYKVDVEIEEVRKDVAKFIDCEENEIAFTSGSTEGMNLIAEGYCKKILKKGDEILISELEHASNVLPWFKIAKETGAVIKYVDLDNKRITIDSFKRSLTSKTKVASFAYVSNVLGYKIPAKEMCEMAHKNNIIFILDGAQATPHMKVSMKNLNCDFYVFSAHKLGGPTGIGVLYGKTEYLQECDPIMLGGGMNKKFDKDGSYVVYNSVRKFEAGTPHIEGILGLGAIVKYIDSVGFEYIEKKEKELRDRALDGLRKLEHIEIYNEDNQASTITFNIKNVFAQDAASYFAKYNICLRAGQHCAKLIDGVIDTYASVRCSFYFYNTIEEVDKFIEVASKGSDFLDAYF